MTWDEKSGLSLDLFKVNFSIVLNFVGVFGLMLFCFQLILCIQIPTCCACQLQNVSPFTSTKKLSQKPDAGIQENVIAEEPSVFLTAVTKPGLRHQVIPFEDSFVRERFTHFFIK